MYHFFAFSPNHFLIRAVFSAQVHPKRHHRPSMSTQEQGQDSTRGVSGTGSSSSDHPKPVASNPPSAQFTNGLLVASGSAFLTGIFGSLWYQGRQERRKGISTLHKTKAIGRYLTYMCLLYGRSVTDSTVFQYIIRRLIVYPYFYVFLLEIDRAAAGTPVGPSLQSLNDLKMAESLLKEGRMLGVKAFAIATTMCISGAVLVVGGTRWALDVETVIFIQRCQCWYLFPVFESTRPDN